MQQIPRNGHDRPAQGLLRLTWPQVEKIQTRYGALCAFLADHGDAEARLIMVVKRGNPRFSEMETSANGRLPTEGTSQLSQETIQDIDAKLSSLCGFTAQTGGDARLILIIGQHGDIEMKMSLSEELSPTRGY